MSQIPKERPLTPEEIRDWQGCVAHAFQELPIGDASQTPTELAAQVDHCVDEWQAGRRPDPEKSDVIDTALSLGAVWGDQLVRQFGWEWTVVIDGGHELYAVAAKDRSLVIYPGYYVKACLDDPTVDCTVALAFNMLVAGKITGIPPRSYEDVMSGVMHIVPKAPRI
jgi:hypothetical protein